MVSRNPFHKTSHAHALQGLLWSRTTTDFAGKCPSQLDASKLWDIFYLRVDPLIRISFSWRLKPLQLASTITGHQGPAISQVEYAFIFSLYLMAVVSLSEDECRTMFSQHRSVLLSNYQSLCEEALAATNIFCMTDIMVLKTLTFYMVSSSPLRVHREVD